MLIQFVVVGVILYLIYAYVPMPAPLKTVFNIFCVVVAVWFLLQIFGVSIPSSFHFN